MSTYGVTENLRTQKQCFNSLKWCGWQEGGGVTCDWVVKINGREMMGLMHVRDS